MKKIVVSSLTLFSSIAVFAIGQNKEAINSSNNNLVVAGFFVVLLALLIVPLPVIRSSKKNKEKIS